VYIYFLESGYGACFWTKESLGFIYWSKNKNNKTVKNKKIKTKIKQNK